MDLVTNYACLYRSCLINNTIICSNSHIAPNTVLDGCKVGYNFKVDSGEYKNDILCHERE